ncbi:MAG: hypothetical protein VYD54_10800, partial [Bdellovibrionota bacterium]|nr:hypothetical protein [Bdellovibrionota bacterium]
MRNWEKLGQAKLFCLLLSLISVNGWSDFSGANYEVDENGAIYSRTLDVEGTVTRRKTRAERMANKRRRMERRNDSRLIQKLEHIRIKQERKLSRKLGKALNKVKRQEMRSSEYVPEARNLDYTPQLPQPTELPPQIVQSQEPVVTEVEERERNIKFIPYAGMTNLSSSSFKYDSQMFPGIAVENTLSPSFSIGLDFNIGSMKVEDNSYYYSSEMKYKQWSLEMYSKFFFKDTGRFLPYVGAGLGYKNITMDYENLNSYGSYYSNNDGVKGHSFFASALVGTEFYFNSRFGLNAHFKY